MESAARASTDAAALVEAAAPTLDEATVQVIFQVHSKKAMRARLMQEAVELGAASAAVEDLAGRGHRHGDARFQEEVHAEEGEREMPRCGLNEYYSMW